MQTRPRSILIAGASGRLGRELSEACARRGLEITCPARSELDIGDVRQVEAALARHRPWAVINAAAIAGTKDGAQALFAINSLGAENLARACTGRGLPFVTFSSDRVFDGALQRPYVEGDATCPACLLGFSKAEAERRVARIHGEALIFRMSSLFGVEDAPQHLLSHWAGRRGSRIFFTATYVPDVVRTALDLLIDGETGTWHLANHGAVSLDEIARIFEPAEEIALPARPLVMLASARAVLMPSLTDALTRQKDLLASRAPDAAWSVAAE